MTQKTCIVTGSNSGIGKSLAVSLARTGAEVIMVCRNEERGREALADVVRESGSAKVELWLCDVGDMGSVRAFCDRWKNERGAIDVLCNNAGVYLPSRTTSRDGHEMTFAINHLGPFLMTNLLLDRLEGARVITTSSMAHLWGKVDVERVADPPSFVPMRVYGTSKLCNVLFTRELAKRTSDRGIAASCFHPGAVGSGFAQDEKGLLDIGMRLVKWALLSPEKGADTGLWLATSDEGGAAKGGYYVRRKERRTSAAGRDDALAQALWTKSLALTGLA